MNRPTLPIVIFSSLVCAVVLADTAADDVQWGRFRGPNGTGVSHATTVPVEWTDGDYNWKIAIPGAGHSSPVVWDHRIYLTAADRATATRTVLCLDTSSGRTLWRRDYPSEAYRQHGHNNYASATPAADARGVVVTWTTPEQVVLLALDADGHPMWRRDLGPFVGARGSGTSPIIAGDLVLLANDQEDPNQLPENMNRPEPIPHVGKSFLIAVDRRTGKTRWQLDRRTGIAAYSTPCIFPRDDGTADAIFTSTAHGITAVDLATGRVRWEAADVLPERCVGSPVFGPGLVIGGFGRGLRGTRYVALRPGSRAEGVEPTLAFDVTTSVPLVPTPLVTGGRLFLWADDGVVTCIELATGGTVWRERVGGSFYSSPVCVDGRLYCANREGEIVVLAAAGKFEILARVELGEPCFATPAVAGGVIYWRTHGHLFSLGGKR